MNAKNIMRWLVIVSFGGHGIYVFVDGVSHLLAHEPTMSWFFMIPFLLVYSGLFIAVSYLAFQRQYELLCTLVSTLAALLAFGFLTSLSKRFGIHERLAAIALENSPWSAAVEVVGNLAALLIPFYAARWVFHRGQTFLAHVTHVDEHRRAD
jgi:uncharacterized membrane protein YkgB